MTGTVEERVRRVVADVFGLPLAAVSLATSSDTVGDWDSANVLNLLMAVEAEFGVTLSTDDAADFLSVELIVAILRERGLG